MKKKILIRHFPNLNNYGSGMMGLVTVQALADRFGSENIEIYCDFNKFADLGEIHNELRSNITLKRYINKTPKKIAAINNSFHRKIRIILNLMFSIEGKEFDCIIVLGGDDLSEFYSKHGAALGIFNYWKSSFYTNVILLGQTMGPFNNPLNKFATKYLLPRINVYARDPWCVAYMREQFGVKIQQTADLALMDLPLQADKKIEAEILERYQLTEDSYVTIVVSGLQNEGFYCNDFDLYLDRYKTIIKMLSDTPQLIDKKICLLAHTFPPYGNEAALLKELVPLIPKNIQNRLVLVTDRILQTRARFILGNGLFTITGRMHAAVSTFQMGKPAICLSYSPKYKGVIGGSLGRYDLVIESGESSFWVDGSIVSTVMEKVEYLLKHYDQIKHEIIIRGNEQKILVKKTLDNI